MRVVLFLATVKLAAGQIDTTAIPDGVTICDGSEPVGAGAAFLLHTPIPFCMNNGTCKEDYADHPEGPCHCGSLFEGTHCEFATGTKPDCNLHCFSGGRCQTGVKSFELMLNEFMATEDMQYCLCTEDKSGQYCEKDRQQCGEDHCLNGGTCVTIEQDEGTVSEHCDCTTAYTGSEAYAGEFCQHKATSFCSAEADHNGHLFCVNGGSCREGTHMGCNCPEGFMGPVCEFRDEEYDDYECNLECQNNGICRKGAKDVSFLEKFGLNRHLFERYNNDFEHCVCPVGYSGIDCSLELEVCPGREKVCMHGGQCEIVVVDGEAGITCDCAKAQTTYSRYQGDFCEARSTQWCIVDNSMTPDGDGYDAFCTNLGECLDFVQPGEVHPGCSCPEGLYGEHCEYGKAAEAPMSRAMVIGLSVAIPVLAILIVFVVFCRNKRRKRVHKIRRAYSVKGGFMDSPPPPTLEHIHTLEPWMQSRVNLRDISDHHHEDEEDAVSSLAPSDGRSHTGSGNDTVTSGRLTFHQNGGSASLMKGSNRSAGTDSVYSDYGRTFINI